MVGRIAKGGVVEINEGRLGAKEERGGECILAVEKSGGEVEKGVRKITATQ